MFVILSGTNRPGSRTRKIAGLLRDIYVAQSVQVQILDLADLPGEIFLPHAYAQRPPGLAPFILAIRQASGMVVVIPEYNGSFPGVLKYFIDLLPFPESFEGKPVCFVGLSAGAWGALRAVEQLQQIWTYRNAFVYPNRVFLPKIQELIDEEGNWQNDDLLQRLQHQAAGFIQFVQKWNQ